MQRTFQESHFMDTVWVVPDEKRRYNLLEELTWTKADEDRFLRNFAPASLRKQVKVILGNGYACSAPACLLAAHSSLLRKSIQVQAFKQPGAEIIIHLGEMASLTNAGLYNVMTFIQFGQIKFLEIELENILRAASDLKVVSLVCLICQEMAARVRENTLYATPMLYTATACLSAFPQYRSIVVDSVAQKFHDVAKQPDFAKFSFEMLYTLISSPLLQENKWIVEIYEAIIYWLINNNDQSFVAPALFDNINFKNVNASNVFDYMLKRSMEVPGLGPVMQIFLMDALYAKFSDNLRPIKFPNYSMTSSIETFSGLTTAQLPSQGPFGSPITSSQVTLFGRIPTMESGSVSNEASMIIKQPQSALSTIWQDVITDYENPTTTFVSTLQGNISAPNSDDAVSLERWVCSEELSNLSEHSLEQDDISSLHTAIEAPIRNLHVSHTDGTEKATESETNEAATKSATDQSTSKTDTVSSSKRRPKFEQIPLLAERPKSRKEKRKERQEQEKNQNKKIQK